MTTASCTPTEVQNARAGVRNCPLCGADNEHEHVLSYSRDQWKLKGCHDCDAIYLENPPLVEALVADYNWTSTFKVEAKRRRGARPVLSRISNFWKHWRVRWLPRRKLERLINRYVKSGRLLDIGCGTAEHFDRVPDSIKPYGIEIDLQAIGTARERALKKGGDVIHADALTGIAQFKKEPVDGIIMHSFLEHEVAPLELLHAARRSLNDRGVVIIKVPNFNCWSRQYCRGKDWPGFRFPDHVNYFTPQSLIALVEQAGLRVLRFKFWDRLPSSDNMWLVATR